MRTAAVMFAFLTSCGDAFSGPRAPTISAISSLKQELFERLDRNGGLRGSGADDATINVIIKNLIDNNPTKQGLDSNDTLGLAPGTWRVEHAPHIRTLANLAFTQFDPIEYHLESDGSIRSTVKYSNLVLGEGWLGAAGTFSSSPATLRPWGSRIRFNAFWWNPKKGARNRAEAPVGLLEYYATGELPIKGRTLPVLGAVDGLVQRLGQFGFIDDIGYFPVAYLDEDLCVFDFPPLGVQITATKRQQGGFLGVAGEESLHRHPRQEK